MKSKFLYLQLIILVITLIISYFLVQDKRMSDNWMGPYLSAAHNLEWSGTFNINIQEVKYFMNLDVNSQDNYKFKEVDNLIHYNHNPIGYVYLIKAATLLFPFIGDQKAIILFQCLVYFFICFLLLTQSELCVYKRWLFFVFFVINPVILRFIPFNFYYFWQIMPSVFFGYLILSKTPKKVIISILVFLFPFIILTRPTIIFTLPIILFFLHKRLNLKVVLLSAIYIVMLTCWLYKPIKKNIWHTIYTGIGAYENDYNIELNDGSTYKLYQEKTKEKLNASLGGNYYNDDVIDNYTNITKIETLKIFKESPFLIIKNSFVNTLQAYSIGYVNKGGDILNYIIAISGFIIIIIMLYFKKYQWFLMIGLSVGTFTLYYPPVQGYMFGAYLLIILGLLSIRFKIKSIF